MKFQILFNMVTDEGGTPVGRQINFGDNDHSQTMEDATVILNALAHDHNVKTPPPIVIFSY